MTLLRALHAELLKMKRTIALKMVVIAPAVLVLLILFMASQAPFSTLGRQRGAEAWTELADRMLALWAVLMLPLYISLQTALVAGLDHSGNQWKSLLARPVPRWTLYVAKLIVAMAMTAAGGMILVCGILVNGAVLPYLQSDVAFGLPVPLASILLHSAEIAGLVFLALTIQHWVSLRWRSFSIAIGVGMVGMVVGFFAASASRQIGSWPQYFPWTLPMLVIARPPHNLEAPLLVGGAMGLVVAAAGCWDFCTREVT